MKTVSKILLAGLGSPFVIILLLAAAVRRMFSPPRFSHPRSVFLYSQVTWDEVWQRPQQYAWLASAHIPVLYCCPVQIHNLLFLRGKWRPLRVINDSGRTLLVLSPLIFSGHFKYCFIHEINSLITHLHIKLAVRGAGAVHALVNTPFGLSVIRKQFISSGVRTPALQRLVYDVIDDFTVFDWSPSFGKSMDTELTHLADKVIAGTDVLAEKREAEFIPCGVDYQLFSTPQMPPPDISELPRPVIGYFGTISERVDFEIITQLADHFSHGTIALIGPIHLPAHLLPQRSNIHYLGLRRNFELPAYAQAFDVALIPFRITEATVKLNPVKTLEYLAAGLPVVATSLPDLVKFYSEIVHIAASPDEFVEAVQRVLAQPSPDRKAAGREIARKASWEQMVDQINQSLGLHPPPAPALEEAASS